ncbi:MAG: FIG024746: hypothetical protein [uncultured Thiotrichaceae bacterium]|uniref:Low-complexity protein n=1 Tax=uncultured Thiotrichaceae bacterium TaxID=298394 RepID=A0A6S6UE07_9GAMM|nr:MAG: FIG024746: hypothetical protein [uncultured Thiotrichaceae bacterium]
MTSRKNLLTLAATTTLAGSLLMATSASAAPELLDLSAQQTITSVDKMSEEGKCGEGKCGGDKGKEEGKCGEGKCGEGKCGGDKGKEEGKCGEGKCGEGKCGGGK